MKTSSSSVGWLALGALVAGCSGGGGATDGGGSAEGGALEASANDGAQGEASASDAATLDGPAGEAAVGPEGGAEAGVDAAVADVQTADVVPAGDGAVVTPGDPGAVDVRLTVDTTARRRAISPYIYGWNSADFTLPGTRRATLTRLGGNRLTAYNWENNASNAGTDYMNQNDNYLCQNAGCAAPGETVRRVVAGAQAAGAATIVTVPIVGYVAADTLGGGDVNRTANYLMTRFRVSRARKGSAFSLTPDATDGFVNQDEFVNWVERTFPTARTDPARTVFYMLDNEPDLWSSTHPRIHPNPARYDEMVSRTVDYAGAIKAVAPSALVFGPVNYGYAGYMNLQNAPDAAGRDFLDFFLDSMRAAEATAGRRLLDVLDVHFYPEAQGGGVRITASTGSNATQQARMQAPRSLWDPTYREDSWITRDVLNGPLTLLPRLQSKINAHYPGTRLSLSEYNHGGGDHISGAVAEADTLGIFGREGLFAATLWELGDSAFLRGALAMYRDYDGAGGAFGDTSVAGDTSDVARVSVYASVDSAAPNRVVLVAINRADTTLNVGVAVTHTGALGTARAWQLSGTSATPTSLAAPTFAARNALRLALPQRSVTTVVLTP